MIYASTSCLKGGADLSYVLEAYSQIGILNVELGSGHTYIEDVEDQLRRHSEMNFIVHNFFPPTKEPFILNLAALNDRVRQKSIEVCKGAIDLCSDLGYPLYSFHPGFRVERTLDPGFELSCPVVPYERAFSAFSRSVEDIVAYSLDRGVMVAVENLEHKNDAYMMTCPWEFKRLLEIFPGLCVLLDLGHLEIASRRLDFRIEDFMECVGGNVAGVHIHENNGREDLHLPPSEDKAFKRILNVDCTRIILECRGLDGDGIVRNLRRLEQYMDCGA